MNIFLVRHGQTAFNKSNTHQYSSTPLSPYGLKQANSIALRLKEAKIDKIYSSPLLRAIQTAEVISKVSKKEFTILDELKELKKPSVIQGKLDSDLFVQQVNIDIINHLSIKDWHYLDEENFWDIRQRVSHLMDFLEKEKKENILLITHGAVIKMIIGLSLFKEQLTAEEYLSIYKNMDTYNTGITQCDYSKESGWNVVRVNDTTHLDA